MIKLSNLRWDTSNGYRTLCNWKCWLCAMICWEKFMFLRMFVMSLRLFMSRRSWVVLRGRSSKHFSLQAKTRLCWWVTLWLDDTHDDAHVYQHEHDDAHVYQHDDITTHMMIDTNLTHGASPCLHGWEHMSARRCHLTKSNKQLLPSCCQSTSLANYVNNFERSNIVGYPHLNNQPIGAINQFCFCKFVFQI